MIQANELRIGNIIMRCGIDYDSGGNRFRDREGDESIIVRCEEISMIYKGSDIFEPIPLTEEWLIKLGLKDRYSDEAWSWCDCPGGPWDNYTEIIESDDKTGYIYMRDYKHLRYVHQLQNLYFALTGQELTINNQK